MQKADHSGHRARMKKKFLSNGLDSFEPHEVLEIMLYYAIPQRNTNDIAKNLIDCFGSFSAVLDASVEALKREGLTEHQAVYLKMMPSITRLYMLDKYSNPDKIIDFTDISAFIKNKFIGYEEEENVLLILADTKGKEVYSGMIAHGDFDSAEIPFRDVVSLAINYSAVTAFVAHNHPSGFALPSQADVIITRSLKEALALVKVTLLDHFIVADGDCVSMAESGLL